MVVLHSTSHNCPFTSSPNVAGNLSGLILVQDTTRALVMGSEES